MPHLTPSEIYSAKIALTIFGDPAHGTRSPTWIAEKLGVPKSTAHYWRKHPDKIPAWQYLRILTMIQ